MLQYTPDLFVEAPAARPIAPITGPQPCTRCQGTGVFVSFRNHPVGECFSCHGTGTIKPKAEAIALGHVDRLMDCFEAAAKTGLKRPVMRFDGFQASLAPATGRNPGAVYLKTDGMYLGKIVGGRFFATGDCNVQTRSAIESAMADPLQAAIAYGRRSGACSCCGRTLTDKKSVERGIGPVCAENFGL